MSRVTAVWLCLLAPSVWGAESKPVGLLPRAEEVMWRVNQERDSARRFELADQVLSLADQAVAQSPKDPSAHLMRAHALEVHDVDRPESCRPGRCEQALEALLRARDLDKNGVFAARIANELGLVYSKLSRFPEALAEYDRALNLVDGERRTDRIDEIDRSVLYGNSAETLMGMGRTDEAIARYRLARDAASPPEQSWLLANYGLALALDRDDQGAAAFNAARKALEQDPEFYQLRDDGVFFEPLGDKWAYLALSYEAAGDLWRAHNTWRKYLATRPSAKWARRAQTHLDGLRGKDLTPDTGLRVMVVAQPIDHVWHSSAQVNEALQGQIDGVRLCYARALREHPGAEGDLLMGLQVHPLGPVMRDNAPIFTSSLPPAVRLSLDRCIQLVARNWRFPPASSLRDRLEPLQLEQVTVAITLRPK